MDVKSWAADQLKQTRIKKEVKAEKIERKKAEGRVNKWHKPDTRAKKVVITVRTGILTARCMYCGNYIDYNLTESDDKFPKGLKVECKCGKKLNTYRDGMFWDLDYEKVAKAEQTIKENRIGGGGCGK